MFVTLSYVNLVLFLPILQELYLILIFDHVINCLKTSNIKSLYTSYPRLNIELGQKATEKAELGQNAF